jgi:predicted TIM-barrel fold metal-dependent hydrolase
MNDIIYIDAYAAIGKEGRKDELTPWKTESLLDEMEHTGIHGSLVYHNVAREYDCAYGNRMLNDELDKSPRLFPCWVLLPHHTGEMPVGSELVARMLDNGVRAAKLCPKYHNYTLEPSTCGSLLGALEDAEILLSIDIADTSYAELAETALRHPRLPILLTSAYWSQVREILPFMDRCPNVHVEFSALQANYAVERFAERYGPERCLLGTNAMHKSPGAAKAFIDYAELSDDARRLIAGGNLARLLHVEVLPEKYPARDDGEILTRVKQGQPLDHIEVIDSHAHMLHDGGMGVGILPMAQGDADNMIARNRRMGVDHVMISSWIGIFADCEEGNRVLKQAIDRYPDDILGYATIDPNYLDSDEFAAWITRAHDEWGFPGMKPYFPRVGIPYNSPRYDPWYEYGNEHRLVCLLHSSGGSFVKEAEEISDKYPEITFLLAHSGESFQTARERLPLVRDRENVFLEITLTPVTLGVIEYMASEVGAEKVIFGTDAPMRDPLPQFGWVCYAHLSEHEKTRILGGNMREILDRRR